jgi:hypothetical protein
MSPNASQWETPVNSHNGSCGDHCIVCKYTGPEQVSHDCPAILHPKHCLHAILLLWVVEMLLEEPYTKIHWKKKTPLSFISVFLFLVNFAFFRPEKCDFDMYKGNLWKKWPLFTRFLKKKEKKLPDFYIRFKPVLGSSPVLGGTPDRFLCFSKTRTVPILKPRAKLDQFQFPVLEPMTPDNL